MNDRPYNCEGCNVPLEWRGYCSECVSIATERGQCFTLAYHLGLLLGAIHGHMVAPSPETDQRLEEAITDAEAAVLRLQQSAVQQHSAPGEPRSPA